MRFGLLHCARRHPRRWPFCSKALSADKRGRLSSLLFMTRQVRCGASVCLRMAWQLAEPLNGVDHLLAAVNAHFAVDVLHMSLHGVLRDAEFVGYA